MIRPGGFATILMLAAMEAGAQVGGPYFSPEIRAKVIDADTAKPIEGAVAVARWEWLEFRSAGFNSGAHYTNLGQAVHVAESSTDAQGRIDFAHWVAKPRTGGKMDEHAPRVLVFKSGYEPLVMDGYKSGQPLRLQRAGASTASYVASLVNFEEQGLQWRMTDDWPAFPKMVLALHREKVRLGEDGRNIPAATVMRARSGTGQLVDAAHDRPHDLSGVLKITWTLRRTDGAEGTRLLVQTKNTGSLQGAGEFFVSPWRLPSPAPAGWEIDPEVRPLVRVYVPGYATSDEVKWPEAGGTVELRKRPAGRDAYREAIRAIRSEVDAALAKGDRDEAMRQYRFLLYQQRYLCDTITPDLRQGACYDESSDVYRYVAEARRVEKYVPETDDGTLRIVVESGNQEKAAPAARVPVGPPPAKGVSGFSIEAK